MLGCNRGILAGTRLGHDGRSESKHVGLDDQELSRPSYHPSPIHRYGGRLVGRAGEERQGQLYLRISSTIYDFEVSVPPGSKTVSRGLHSTFLWVRQRLPETDTSSK